MPTYTSFPDPRKLSLLRRVARVCSTIVITIGLIVLFGWVANIQTLTCMRPGWVSMKVNTAISLICCGASLFTMTLRVKGENQSPRCRIFAFCAALMALVIGSVSGLEYLLGVNFHIDDVFFHDLTHAGANYLPGRMSPISAANFIFLSSALVLLAANRAAPVTQLLAGGSGFMSLVVLTGTSYGLESLIGKMHYTAVAFHTNLCFILLFAGIYCATGENGVMRLLTDSGAAGKVLRRLLPTAVFVPLVISTASAALERMGFFGLELGISIFTITTIVAFAALVWRSALFLRRSESETQESEARLRESLRRYTFLAETMPQIIWTAKPDGNVDYFNQRWFDYTGQSLEQTRDWGWKRVVHPDDLQNCLDHWTMSLKTGRDYEVEYRFRRASDGTYRWHLGRAFPLRNEDGELIQWVGASTDIDDQKRAQSKLEQRVTERTAELARARERLQAVLDSATQVGIITVNPTGWITEFNRGAELMFGYTAAEVIGKHTPSIFHVEWEVAARANELSKEFGRPIRGIEVFVGRARAGHNEEREWTLVRKNGTPFNVNLMITAMRDANGTVIGFLGIVTDITARKKAEILLRDQALILDLANDTIFIRDISDLIIYWNQGAERLYGWTKEEAKGRITHELFHTTFPQPLPEIRAHLAEKGSWEGELVHTRRDGTLLTVASSWTLQRDASGEPVSVIEINHDISDRKKAELELKKSRQRLDAILNGSIDGVIVYETIRDADGKLSDFRFTMINPAAEKLMHHSAASLLGHGMLEKFPNAREDGLFEKFVRIVEDETTLDFEYLSSRGESPRWYRIAGVKLGQGLAISYTEITARKLYEKELQDAKEHAELADRAKSDFLANMSHEIRTPMNGVIGLTGLLLETKLNPDQRNLSETIRTSAESLLGVINDVLDFSKIEAGKLSFEQLDFDLHKVVEDTLEIMASTAQAKGLELLGGVEPESITRLRGDPNRVHQVLTNLVSNALKFTKSGEVVVRVRTESQTEKNVVIRFEIKDTGIGIPAGVRANLFQPFVQADSSTSRQFGGTGLGLAICKRLAESMNGHIGVESTPGKGSTFWVTLEFARQAEDGPAVLAPDDLANSRVLVVEDNETSRDFLHRQITAWRLRGDTATNGDEALAMLRRAVEESAPYAIALVDLQMPAIDGLALANLIYADPQLRATRVILLTPIGKPVPSGESTPPNLAGCCQKPVRQSALFDCLIRTLSRPVGAEPSPQALTRSKSKPPTQLKKDRILLAEDNIVNQEVALGNLRKLGYQADIVTNGLEVLEALETKKYDVILMDCQMPELDGYETTRQIRLRERDGRRTRIIAMTANVMVGDREKCLAAGMDDYVAKPLRRVELRAALERTTPKQAKPYVEAVLQSMGEDGPEELAKLVGLFIATAPESIAKMRQALEQQNAKDLARAAHTLKGSCSNLGATPLREVCARIEQAGRDGQLDGANELVASADAELQRLCQALKSHLESKLPA